MERSTLINQCRLKKLCFFFLEMNAAGGAEKAVKKSIVEKAQDVLATREQKPRKKVPKLMQKTAKPVYIEPSKNGKISTAGRQQIATINGKDSFSPRWNPFVSAGSIVFPNFDEDPLSARAVNEYKGVVFKYAVGEEYTFPAYQAEVLAMFKVGISDELNLSEAIIVTRCRKVVRRCNNPQSEIYAFGGLEEHTEAKRLRRVRFIPKFQCPTLMATSPRMQFRIFAEAVTRISLANRRKLSDKS